MGSQRIFFSVGIFDIEAIVLIEGNVSISCFFEFVKSDTLKLVKTVQTTIALKLLRWISPSYSVNVIELNEFSIGSHSCYIQVTPLQGL